MEARADPALCTQSLEDLRDDFAGLTELTSSLQRRLSRRAREVSLARGDLGGAFPCVAEGLACQLGAGELQLRELRHLGGYASRRPTPRLIRILAERKRVQAEKLRARQGVAASLLVAGDWHSPSIRHSTHSMAGRHSGRVTPYLDDYKRDRHPDAMEFEALWLDEYVDNPRGLALRAVMTSCGMSAFTTILGFMASLPLRGPVLAGRAAYHECRRLLQAGILGRVVDIDDSDSDSVARSIERHRPGAIFLDSLCNSKGLVLPDLERIIGRLASAREPVHLVVDNTARSVAWQPWAHWPVDRASGLRLIVFESLTKLAQFGFDRTAAGMIVAPESEGAALDEAREHLGTNVGDVAVGAIPLPDRRMLGIRLQRLSRNARLLATVLDDHCCTGRLPVRVVYPGLGEHHASDGAREPEFRGAFLALELAAGLDEHEDRERVVKLIMYEARRRGASLAEGTSFGFDTARVYVTAAHSEHGAPFIRVAPGTEHRSAVDELGRAVMAALDQIA